MFQMHTGLPRKPEMTSKQWLHLGAYIPFKEVTVSVRRSDKTKEKGVEGLPGELNYRKTHTWGQLRMDGGYFRQACCADPSFPSFAVMILVSSSWCQEGWGRLCQGQERLRLGRWGEGRELFAHWPLLRPWPQITLVHPGLMLLITVSELKAHRGVYVGTV